MGGYRHVSAFFATIESGRLLMRECGQLNQQKEERHAYSNDNKSDKPWQYFSSPGRVP